MGQEMETCGKLEKMLDAALKQAGEESSVLLGHPLALTEGNFQKIDRKQYFGTLEDAVFVAGVACGEGYSGVFHMFFSLRDAILLSGLLLGIPPARISEKRKLAIMETDDGDAFAEILNQVVGSFNSVFMANLPHKIHLKLSAPRKFIPGTDELTAQEPVPEGDYCLFRYRLNLDGQETDHLDVLIPLSLADLFDTREGIIDKQAAAAEMVTAEMLPDSDAAVTEQTILILEDDPQDRQRVREILAATGLRLVEAPLGGDLEKLVSSGAARLALIGVAGTDEKDLALCAKITAFFPNTPFPIIISARQWTRTAVLKALKYGVRDIIVKPYVTGELVAKVNRLLQAA